MCAKKVPLVTSILMFIIASNLASQNSNIIWLEHYGGSDWDGAYWVEEAGSMDNCGETGRGPRA